MNDVGGVNVSQGNERLAGDWNDEPLFKLVVVGFHEGSQASAITEVADDPQLRLERECLVDQVDIGSFCVF
jgi:hypothetical protein